MAEDERTLLVIKPDGVKKGLVSEIIRRIKEAGLRIVVQKTVRPSRKFIEEFLGNDKEWLIGMGRKAIANFTQAKIDLYPTFGTGNSFKIGRIVREWLITFWLSGDVVPMIVSGPDAIARVREIIGDTIPKNAKPGTIRHDFAPLEEPIIANKEYRCMHNIVHASGNPDEAKKEINIWFKPEEILD